MNLNDKEIMEFLRESIKRNEEEAIRLAREKRQQKINELTINSGMKKRFRKRTFETFKCNDQNIQAYKAAIDFVKNFEIQEQGLLFTGPVGVGKTHLAAAIANKLISELYTVIFGNITDIISQIKSTYSGESEYTENKIIEYLTNVDLLIIDDLGKEYSSKNTNTLLYRIINTLYEDEKLIVVTTNFNAESLANKIGVATVSRLTEMTKPIIMSGKDWRLGR